MEQSDVDRHEGNQDEAFPSDFTLAEENKRVLLALKEFGVEYEKQTSSSILFVRRGERPSFPSEVSIPRDSISDLTRQLKDKIIEHPTATGFMAPSRGYAEIVVRDIRWPRPSPVSERILRLSHDEIDCAHKESERQIPCLPFESRMHEGGQTSRIHLVSTSGGPCVELSNASPLAMLLYGRGYSDRRSLLLTIKLDHDGMAVEKEALIQKTDKVVRSLVYELDVRNGRVLGIAPRSLPLEARRIARPRVRIEKIRYPEIEIEREVADLFNFASHAFDNPPLAFLSYYQTLEYFIPAAVRRSALSKIRRELRDPTFDRDNDNCLLRIVSAAERSVRLPEADQLRGLVHEYVRHDRLVEFFDAEWGGYFSRRGPIRGVEVINSGNATKDLGDQVADRVYQIRNRIVHAKDDPRYEAARVLLPRSQEAESLGPDVELVRLLAMEAVLAGRGS